MNCESPRGNGSQVTDQRLNVYSLAAAAAGVTVLALIQPAEGKVVITKKLVSITEPVSIDLNNDGIPDFEFSFQGGSTGTCCQHHTTLVAKALTGGKVMGHKTSRGFLGPYASALVRGAKIGAAAHFSSAKGQIAIEHKSNHDSTFGYDGNWYLVSNRYLGVKFLIGGKTHYGWIRLSVNVPGNFSSTITAYAYETVANKTVQAGETSNAADDSETEVQSIAPSLGMLAAGVDGIALWRRDDAPGN
ncbi:MAG: hypothetical protein WCB05_02710 [Candidatus Sulfotelmatobacter sp.]|jgi:hypothetical protein